MATTIEEIERRLHARDTTLDLPAIVDGLIAAQRERDGRITTLQQQVTTARGELVDRDKRLERSQLEVSRLQQVIGILRERMAIDLETHRQAQRALDAFDAGKPF